MITNRNEPDTAVRTGKPRGYTRRRWGIALTWTVLVMFVMIAFVGLAIDTGFVVLGRQQLQNATDAAALAGAGRVRSNIDAARAAASNIADANAVLGTPVAVDLNTANDPAGEIVVGRYNRQDGTFTPRLTNQNAVKVVGRRTDATHGGITLAFGPIAGVNTVDLTCEAIAMIGGGTGSGLLVLNPTSKCSLSMNGTLTLNVIDVTGPAPKPGTIQVNSDATTEHPAIPGNKPPYSVCCGGASGELLADVINVVDLTRGVEDYCIGSMYDGEVNGPVPPLADPLAYLPPPPLGPNRGRVEVSTGDNVFIEPGYYRGGISMTGGTLTLAPGIYVLDGTGLDINGGAKLYANGVMFYVIDSTPNNNKYSGVNLGGHGEVIIRGLDETYGEYEGMSIFQARDNTNESSVRGTGLMDIGGTLYFPSNHLWVTGTGVELGNQLIVDTIDVSGTGTVNIRYDGRNPAPGYKVFLVE